METSVIPVRALQVRTAIVGKELYLVRGTDAFRLGEIEVEIWNLLDGHRSVEEIAETIARDFNEELDTVRGDITAFTAELLDQGLVEVAV